MERMYSDLPDKYWTAIENINNPKYKYWLHIPYLIWCLSFFFLELSTTNGND